MATFGLPRAVAAVKKVHFLKLLKYYECDGDMSKYFIHQVRHSHLGIRSAGRQIQGTKYKHCLCSRNGASVQAVAFRFSSTGILESSQTNVTTAEKGIETLMPDKIDEIPLVLNTDSKEIIQEPSTVPLDTVLDVPLDTVVDVAQTLGEPSFSSLGLGGWTPVGIVEQCLEFLHISCGLPWWGAIFVGTCAIRILMFPLVIISQRNAAKMSNNLPQLQIIQKKMTEARQSGDKLEAAMYGHELLKFMNEKGINPLKNMVVPFAQAPIFLSFFLALRGMGSLPVESMKHGGLYWFKDLTIADPYYLLPIITCATLQLTIEIGTDSARPNATNSYAMNFLLRALPVCIFPFVVNFSGAILCYWVSSNFVALIQVATLKIPAVRKFFNIEPLVVHPKDSLPVKKQGFVKGFKESWNNMKISQELGDRQRMDQIRFERAGMSPVQKTYKYDPTQPRKTIAAKKREET